MMRDTVLSSITIRRAEYGHSITMRTARTIRDYTGGVVTLEDLLPDDATPPDPREGT